VRTAPVAWLRSELWPPESIFEAPVSWRDAPELTLPDEELSPAGWRRVVDEEFDPPAEPDGLEVEEVWASATVLSNAAVSPTAKAFMGCLLNR
jgi:hypothetical protein